MAATTRKGATRAAMTAELLAAHRRGVVQVTIGRASDFFGPWVLSSAMGAGVFAAVLAGKPARVLGNPDLAHTYSYIDDIGRGLVTLGEDSRALSQVWHLPNPETLTTREFIQRLADQVSRPVRLRRTPRLVLRGVGVFVPSVREVVQMLYEFEEPFIVGDSKYVRTSGPGATPLDEALRRTLAWYHHRRAAHESM